MAEKEYIEKQSIIDAVRKEFDWYYQTPIYPEDKGVQNLIARVNRVVRENPAADVVEVVRCKDCVHRVLVGRSPFAVYVCTHNKGLGDNVQNDDFCSYGERKEAQG